MPTKKRLADLNCSLAQALDSVGDWWTLLIVRDLFLGATRFSDIRESLGIARNVLATRLVQLQASGLIERQGTERRPHYVLTWRGRDLIPALVALLQWGDKWVAAEGAPMIVTDEEGRSVAPVAVRNCDGAAVGADSVRFQPGPGAHQRTRMYIEMLARAKKVRG